MTACSVQDPIVSALKQSFRNGASYNGGAASYDGRGLMRGGSSNSLSKLDTNLQIASKSVQISSANISFDAPIRFKGDMVSAFKGETSTSLRPKVIVLNPKKDCQVNGDASKNGSSTTLKSDIASVPKPKVTFFNQSNVVVGYRQLRPAGAGMFNVGNTCYLNSTLQALFHTPALYNYLLSNSAHLSACSNGSGFFHSCMVCALTLTLRESLKSNVIKPSKVYEKLKSICKHMVHGRQEDAHEFLRYLIESLQRSYLISEKVSMKTLDNASKETTPFNQIFGGYMRQDVTCLRCKYVSTTFQHFMDLLLDIRQVSNIEDALQMYFRQEKIGENTDSMYKCEKCLVKVPAKKRCLIERPPAVLCIQLKRFSLLGGKISKPVQLTRLINMSRFINGCTVDVQYKLVSMINHVGPSPNCGHYTAIGEATNGQFFQFDDSSVRPISVAQAMNTASYVVIYEMTKQSWDKLQSPKAANLNSANGHQTNGVEKIRNQPRSVGLAQTSTGPVFKPRILPSTSSTPAANKLGVLASIKKSVASIITSQATTNILPMNKNGLVHYDDDESESESEAQSKKSVDSLKSKNSQVAPASTLATKTCVSGFVPRAVALKKPLQESAQVTVSTLTSESNVCKSASGSWTVTDFDQHNPSVASDGSCGSTHGNWIVTKSSTSCTTEVPKQNGGRVEDDHDYAKTVESKPKIISREPFNPPTSDTLSSRKRGSVAESDNDDYDAEFDRGRTKKVRKSISAPMSDNGQKENPFQRAQTQMYDRRSSDYDRHRRQHSHHGYRGERYRHRDHHHRRHSYGGSDHRDGHHRKYRFDRSFSRDGNRYHKR